MSNLVKLVLAVVLGLTAAGINWLWLSSRAQPVKYVGLASDVDRDEKITIEMLMGVPVPGDAATLSQTFIPFSERRILEGRTATRPYRKGDLVLYRDLEAPEAKSVYEELGPFRLLSVGNRFARSVKGDETISGSDGDNIAIAVPWPYDQMTKQLVDITSAARDPRDDEADAERRPRIVRLHVLPSAEGDLAPVASGEAGDFSLGLAQNQRALFVSLEGIENVPRVLLVGQNISFVIRNDK